MMVNRQGTYLIDIGMEFGRRFWRDWRMRRRGGLEI